MVLSFYILAVVAVVAAIMVITRPNPMHSALWLLVTFLCIAGIYLLLNAEFVAAIQLIIYAGGVLVLYIFVIMLVDLSKEAALRAVFHRPTQVAFAVVFAILLFAVVWQVGRSGLEEFTLDQAATAGAATDSTRVLAKELFLKYLYPFEIASILLLVAMIGSVILARRSREPASSSRESETR
jgi:NADH-quinone oxidoreductase subunit J